MLIHRDGAALAAGLASYERAWIRRRRAHAATLLRLGHADAAKEFAEWFAQVPVTTTAKFPAALIAAGRFRAEKRQHGELIYLVAEISAAHA